MKTKPTLTFLCALILAMCRMSFAQGTAFTYQGRVTDNGTNFTGAGQFKFALVTSTNANHAATATADAPSNGFITGYQIIDGGTGYLTAPAVTVSGGGGSGAGGVAVISGGVVTGITVTNTGDGQYTTAPIVTIAPPPASIAYTTYWSNDGTSAAGSEPTAAVGVPVADGLFTVVLGDTTLPNMTAIDASLFMVPNLQLRIWFNDGVNGFAALNPVQNLTPTPYAIQANSANSLPGLNIQQSAGDSPDVIGGAAINFISPGVIGATIGGGGTTNWYGAAVSNSITADYGVVGGGVGNTASGELAAAGGGFYNTAGGRGSVIAGGEDNYASGADSVIGGGSGNGASGYLSTVGGGDQNGASGFGAEVGGGEYNVASGQLSTVAGGKWNTASQSYASVGGGIQNIATAFGAIVGGGDLNSATNEDATVPGGYYNRAGGPFSFAAGHYAVANDDGSFVWADDSQAHNFFTSTTSNEFSIRAQNGLRIQSDKGIHLNAADEPIIVRDWDVFATNAPADKVGIGRWGLFMESHYLTIGIPGDNVGSSYFQVAKYSTNGTPTTLVRVDQSGNIIAQGTVTANGVLLTSDRNAKENFEPLDAQTVLAKVAALPMTEWNYKRDPAQEKHIGPMAQDFHAAFGLNGRDDRHISVIDEGGVALAAIKGLNQKLQYESKAKDAEIQQLRQTVEQLKEIVNQLAQQQKGDNQRKLGTGK